MEAVYLYNKKIEKDITKILKSDEFMRISYIVRESSLYTKEKESSIMYVKASSEEIDKLDQRFIDLGAEKIIGDEEIAIINSFNAEEENAACGMGMMFCNFR